jgi:hypothetical protein
MVHGPTFATFQAAYLAVLRHITNAHQYEISTRDRHALEVINTSFTIANPTAARPTWPLGGRTWCSTTPRRCGTWPAATTLR